MEKCACAKKLKAQVTRRGRGEDDDKRSSKVNCCRGSQYWTIYFKGLREGAGRKGGRVKSLLVIITHITHIFKCIDELIRYLLHTM